jgi:hypothetical protein
MAIISLAVTDSAKEALPISLPAIRAWDPNIYLFVVAAAAAAGK